LQLIFQHDLACEQGQLCAYFACDDDNATAIVQNLCCGCRYPIVSPNFSQTEKTFILSFKPPSVSPHQS
jgi:hypothetical protein